MKIHKKLNSFIWSEGQNVESSRLRISVGKHQQGLASQTDEHAVTKKKKKQLKVGHFAQRVKCQIDTCHTKDGALMFTLNMNGERDMVVTCDSRIKGEKCFLFKI